MFIGHKAEWEIFNQSGEKVLSLMCLYDANDYLSEVAEAWEINYQIKTIRITKELDQ